MVPIELGFLGLGGLPTRCALTFQFLLPTGMSPNEARLPRSGHGSSSGSSSGSTGSSALDTSQPAAAPMETQETPPPQDRAAGPGPYKRASRKGAPRRFSCDYPGCDKIYSRAEHLQRHQLNRAAPRLCSSEAVVFLS